jgi:single-strand DNA-binding protein
MNYQKVILVGNATSNAQQRTSRKGDVTYTLFGLGIRSGKEQTTFLSVAVFGKQGEAVAKYVTKGRQVLVEGRITVSDKGRFSVIADKVEFGAKPVATEKSQ